jgi:AraC-like DNA-binding protein
MGDSAGPADGSHPLAGLVRSTQATVLRDTVASVTPHEVTPVGQELDGVVGVVSLAASRLVFVRYGGDVVVESPPTGGRVVATVPLGPMHVTTGSAATGELKTSGFVLASGERTIMRPDAWAGSLVFAADEEDVERHQRSVFGDERISAPNPTASPMLTRACRQAWSATSSISPQTPREVVEQFLGAVEDHLLTALVLAWGDPPGHSDGRPVPRRIDSLREWLVANHGPGITVTDMAREMRVSVRQLQWIVQQRLGLTPTELLREVRLERVRELLRDADPERVTVAMIAHECGFVHLGRFSAQYRNRFGETPSSSLRLHMPPA